MDGVLILYTTWPDAATAQAVGTEAVERRLCACVNILAPIISVYRWQGAVEQAAETPMILKTTAGAAPALRAFLLERHPCELPCVVALPVDAGASHAPYLAWIAASASGPI